MTKTPHPSIVQRKHIVIIHLSCRLKEREPKSLTNWSQKRVIRLRDLQRIQLNKSKKCQLNLQSFIKQQIYQQFYQLYIFLAYQMENQSQNQNFDDNTQQVAGFVGKTFQILNSSDYIKIIYWSSNGTQFTIKDVAKFEEIVLPKFFRHNKMNSFVRQLNMYGFHKTKHNNFKSTFKHPMFQKGKQQLLPLVKRKLKSQQNQMPENEQLKQNISVSNIQKLTLPEKQPDVTSVSLQKYFNFSTEFIGTTKMINFSLKKVSCNDFSSLENFQEADNQDCASIEDEIEPYIKQEDNNFLQFQNVSCFFSSRFNI